MFTNLNGSIGLGLAAICVAPLWGTWPLFPVGIVLLGLVYLVRHHKGWARPAALIAAALSLYALVSCLPAFLDISELRDAVDLVVSQSENLEGIVALVIGGLALLSFTNACLTIIWGQSRQTARSFEKLGI